MLFKSTDPIHAVTGSREGTADIRPELEFVFRTLVDLRVDMDDLRREFDVYRRGEGIRLPGEAVVGRVGPVLPAGQGIEIGAYSPGADSGGFDEVSISPDPVTQDTSSLLPDDVVVFRPGMTMDDLERQAITAALSSVNGNRRKAADLLGIGTCCDISSKDIRKSPT